MAEHRRTEPFYANFHGGSSFLHYHHFSPPLSSPPCDLRHELLLPSTRIFAKIPPMKTNSSSERIQESEPKNALLKIAWYGSEILGIAASFLRSPPAKIGVDVEASLEILADGSGKLDRSAVVDTIKSDFERSYFVTGNVSFDAYEEDCEFADPAGSFRGLRRFTRNCTNFGYLLERSTMKLMKWEDFEDKGIGHWRFSCVMTFPWKPILSATGYTEYYFDEKSGKICRHVEHWNVPKMALLKQVLRPSRGLTRGNQAAN